MDDEPAIDIVMSANECGFLLSIGEPDIGIDLAIKLSLARINDKSAMTLPLSRLEHSQLIQVLTNSVTSTTKRRIKQLSEKLIKRLKQASKQTISS